MTTDEDVQYQRELRGKSFMAGVSPWFYTSMLPPFRVSCQGRDLRIFRVAPMGKELALREREALV